MSRDLNRMEILGSVSKDVIVNHTSKGLAIASIPVATKVSRQSGTDIVTYHTVVCFGELAEMAAHFKVNDRIFATGSLQKDSWDDNGVKRYATKLKATHLGKVQGEASDSEQQSPSKKDGSNPWGDDLSF